MPSSINSCKLIFHQTTNIILSLLIHCFRKSIIYLHNSLIAILTISILLTISTTFLSFSFLIFYWQSWMESWKFIRIKIILPNSFLIGKNLTNFINSLIVFKTSLAFLSHVYYLNLNSIWLPNLAFLILKTNSNSWIILIFWQHSIYNSNSFLTISKFNIKFILSWNL